ncbi:thiopeptide-type bacteriocin biosynthesis protein [Streptomyces sp. C1-1]|uniref:thiopeptide-type bacteriocin biosynthesis protein n=1 Tax=Streptomyces sp. C1-1 TaxID=3231173 RepID=UPI003CFD8C0A
MSFLRMVTEYLESGSITSDSSRLDEAADRFIRAGISALEEKELKSSWIERRLNVEGFVPREIYVRLNSLAQELLEERSARNFHFIHKPPGVRIRFESPAQSRIRVREALRELCSGITRDGLALQHHPAVYEPEYKLFGGAESMAGVHGMFTADSLVWVDYWGKQRQAPAWALSLRLIRSLFSVMEIADVEDRDVWDRLGWQAGRKFDGDQPSGWAEISHRIGLMWSNPEHLSSITAAMGGRCSSFEDRAKAEWVQWNREYFQSDSAVLGPRQAAAFLIVFHWNRARLPFSWQAGIATALANVTI